MLVNDKLKLENIAVVIPCYKVRNHIIRVISTLPKWIDLIIIVDDCCPEESGKFVEENFKDSRILILRNQVNEGVGGSVLKGYKVALERNSRIVIKIDGDGQMDPMNIDKLIKPILEGRADYTKGNRFYNFERIGAMPLHRIIGNAGLSFFSKLSTGYWSIFDPNNGFTAITGEVIASLPLEKIEKRYFFESDLLFRLNLARAVVIDVPMDAIYGDEKSNLSPVRSLFEFTFKHIKNFLKRIFYNYFLREFSIATLNLILGIILLNFGLIFGLIKWITSIHTQIPTQQGALILVMLSVLTGLHLILSFTAFDISHEPKVPINMNY